MKKLFTIIIAVLILASGLRVSIDHHYCGGKLAGTKLSFSGRLASCGMETVQDNCSRQISVDKKCCEDQLTYYSLASQYLPEYFKISNPSPEENLQSFPVSELLFSSYDFSNNNSWVLPPGEKLKPGITLSEICVFRI